MLTLTFGITRLTRATRTACTIAWTAQRQWFRLNARLRIVDIDQTLLNVLIDLSRCFDKCVFDVLACFGGCFNVEQIVVVSKAFGFVVRDFALPVYITFVSCNEANESSWSLLVVPLYLPIRNITVFGFVRLLASVSHPLR